MRHVWGSPFSSSLTFERRGARSMETLSLVCGHMYNVKLYTGIKRSSYYLDLNIKGLHLGCYKLEFFKRYRVLMSPFKSPCLWNNDTLWIISTSSWAFRQNWDGGDDSPTLLFLCLMATTEKQTFIYTKILSSLEWIESFITNQDKTTYLLGLNQLCSSVNN